VIKKDDEYPAWVFDLTKKVRITAPIFDMRVIQSLYVSPINSCLFASQLPTRRQLVEKIETEGVDSLTYKEMKRVKRSLTTDLIKKNNADALSK
jgi:hypothetical protein